MNCEKILNKEQMYRLYESGCFGNKLRTWNHRQSITSSGYNGTLSVRYKKPGTKWAAYNVSVFELHLLIEQWVKEGALESLITYNESAPDAYLLIQGELAQIDFCGYALTYSTAKIKMRDALRVAKTHIGPGALLIAKDFFTPSSYSDLHALFDRFPDCTVEFSTYAYNLGTCPGRNTIIWEVRHY